MFSCVQLFATPWTVNTQVPLSMGFSRQEDWSGVPFPSPEHLPNPGSEPRSPFADRFFTIWAIREIKCTINVMCLNHSKTNPPPTQSMEKLSSKKPIPCAKKGMDHWSIVQTVLAVLKTSVIPSTPSPTTPWTPPSPWQQQGQWGPQSNILKDFSS